MNGRVGSSVGACGSGLVEGSAVLKIPKPTQAEKIEPAYTPKRMGVTNSRPGFWARTSSAPGTAYWGSRPRNRGKDEEAEYAAQAMEIR